MFAAYARKFLVAVAAALGVLMVALSDEKVTTTEWVQIVISALGSVGVYYVPNDYTKG